MSNPALLDYGSWTEGLCTFLFRADNHDQPVTLFLDDEVIDSIYGGPGGVQSLASAVRARLRPPAEGTFGRIYQESLGWKVDGAHGYPPSIPLLAVCVVAATRMAAGSLAGGRAISSGNYYDRLRELLRLSGAHAVPGYDEYIPELWKQLKWWMDGKERGRFGVCTLPERPALANIGYALSQALFRQSDRNRLSEFLRAIHFLPQDRLSAEELLVMFRAWAPRSTLSDSAKLMARSEDHALQLAGILATAAAHWDGTARDDAGRKLAQIRLRLRFQPPRLDLLAECPDSFPDEADFVSRVGLAVHLTKAAPGWYEPLSTPVDDEVLAEGLRLQTAEVAVAIHGEKIHVLAQDPNVGGWSSVHQLDSMEEHVLVVRADVRTVVQGYLEEFASPDWSPMSQQVAGLPGGWTMFQRVRIERPPPTTIKGVLSVLVPALRSRASLWGGLPVGKLMGVYLTGGEPAVLIPTQGGDVLEVAMTIDSVTVSASSVSGVIFLHGRSLSTGDHAVTVGPTNLRFGLISSSGVLQPTGTGTIGHTIGVGARPRAITFEAGPLKDHETGESRVTGGAVLDSDALSREVTRPIIVLRAATAYALLGARAGEIIKPVPPRAPEWLKAVGLNANCFEAYPPFRVVWVLSLRASGWHVRLAADIPVDMTEPFAMPNAQVVDWMLPFQRYPNTRLAPAAGATLWASYCAAVSEYLGA